MNPEEKHIAEIERVKAAIKKTNSPMLRRDYCKYLSRLQRELKEYRRYRKC